MKIKTSKGIKEVNEVFPYLETFKNHVLKLDKNIRYDNEMIKKEIESLMIKLKEQDGVVSLSLMRGWLVKNYGFKTKKWGELNYFLERGWNEENALVELRKRNKELKQRNRLCVEYWLNKGFSVEEAINEISKQQQKSSKYVKTYRGKSKQMLSDKGYSEEDIKRICLTPANIEFWINKGVSENEAKNIISKNQTEAAKQVDFEKRLIPSNIEYWVEKGFNYQQAKLKVTERQTTFSLDICVKKYGEEDGLKRFNERQIKWLTNYKRTNFSKISQTLFWGILETEPTIKNDNIFFATYNKGNVDDSGKNNEYRLSLLNGVILPDFIDLDKGKIIEFDGTYYHRSTPENSLREEKRDKMILESGYQVLHISEYDYKKNKQEIINKCINFLTK
jgi:ribosomal protein S16